MRKPTQLDQRWAELMMLCESEAKFRAQGKHPRLLKLLNTQIRAVASEMGFSTRRIITRDFRAERDGDHITKIIND